MTAGPCWTFQELPLPFLPPEEEGEETKQKPNCGPQDSQHLKMSSWGGLIREGRGFEGKSRGLILDPVNVIQTIMSWTLYCPELRC